MSKQGMQLSIDTLVVVILGIVILGGGIFFIQNIISEAGSIIDDVGEREQTRISSELARGQTFVVLDNARSGGYGDHMFALGFINRLHNVHEFKVNIELQQIILQDEILTKGEPRFNAIPEPLYDDSIQRLAPSESITNFPVAIIIPRGSPRATYEYQVEILHNLTDNPPTERYDSPRIIRVTIR